MIRKAIVLFCDEEHGFGDVCFPSDSNGDPVFEPDLTLVQLRKRAREAGWRFYRSVRSGKVDVIAQCPGCVESDAEAANA